MFNTYSDFYDYVISHMKDAIFPASKDIAISDYTDEQKLNYWVLNDDVDIDMSFVNTKVLQQLAIIKDSIPKAQRQLSFWLKVFKIISDFESIFGVDSQRNERWAVQNNSFSDDTEINNLRKRVEELELELSNKSSLEDDLRKIRRLAYEL